jgi:hypothetical protein
VRDQGPERLAGPYSLLIYRLLFGVAAAIAVAAIWLPAFPPMTDLPQHAAQMSIIAHYHDAAWGFQATHRLDFFTPYLLTYLMGAALLHVVNAVVAAKLLVSMAIVGTAVSVHWLTREHGRDPWLALLAWPLSFSASYYWGFLPSLWAVPLGICSIAVTTRYHGGASRKLGLLAALLVLLTSVTHPLMGAFTCVVVGLLDCFR